MATEVGSAYITLLPSLRGFSQRAQAELGRANLGRSLSSDLTRGAADAGTRSGGLFSRAFNRTSRGGVNFPGPSATLLRNIRTYGFALSAVSGLTVGLGLKTATSMEQAQVAFTTMLGSADKAKTFLAGLVQFAQTTPFDLPGVVNASQKLLAFGFSAKDTLPTLTALGDAAAGLSLGTEGLDRLTTAVGQIQAKGRVQSDELLQLTEAGVPALKILANQFGITTAQAQDLVTKGLVPASKAVPALLQGLEKGTTGLAGSTAKFGGLMDKQSRTLGGILSNLRDTVSQGFAQAVQPFLPAIERGLTRALPVLQGAFKQVATFVQTSLIPAFGQVRDVLQRDIIPVIGRFVGYIQSGIGPAQGVLSALAPVFSAIGNAARQVVPTVRDLVQSLVNIGRIIAPVLAPAAAIAAAAFSLLVSALRDVSGVLRTVTGFLGRHETAVRAVAITVGTFAGVLGAIALGMRIFNGALAIARGAVMAFRGAILILNLAMAANPIGLAAVAIIALGAGFIYAWKKSQTFRDVVVAVFKYVGETAVTLGKLMYDSLTLGIRGFLIVASKIPGPFKGAAKSALSALRDVDRKLDETNAWLDKLTAPRVVTITFAKARVDEMLKPGAVGRRGAHTATEVPSVPKPAPKRKPLGSILPTTLPQSTFKLGQDAIDALAAGAKKKKAKAAQSATEIADAILKPLRDLRQQAADLGKSIADAITGSTGLGSLTTQTDILGNSVKQSLGGLIRGLVSQRAQVLAFRKELTTLGKRGLAGTDINQIAGLGLDQGGGLAQTLMGASKSQLKQISSLTGGIRSGASLIGQDRASATFGSQISAEVSRTRTALERKLDDTSLSKKTVADVERAMTSAVKSVRVYTNLVDMDQKQGRRTLTALGR